MTFLQRLGYYLGGFSIGLILLAFFLSGKKTSCEYGPDARVKKIIRRKQLEYTPAVTQQINSGAIDTAAINYLLLKGDVDFSKSKTDLDSCNIYVLEGPYKENILSLTIENCKNVATIQKATIKKAQ